MAKAKSTESAKKPAAESKTPAKAPAKKPAAAKKAAPAAAPSGLPQIDTNLAAQSAAAMLRNRATLTAAAGGTKNESATFKNLKEQIAHPKSAALNSIMGTGGEQKKGSSHFMDQQRGHNQTQGGFNKTGVPRRTNG